MSDNDKPGRGSSPPRRADWGRADEAGRPDDVPPDRRPDRRPEPDKPGRKPKPDRGRTYGRY